MCYMSFGYIDGKGAGGHELNGSPDRNAIGMSDGFSFILLVAIIFHRFGEWE